MNFEITELSDFSGEMAHIYSVTLRGEEQTLLEQFFDDNAEYEAELATIVEKLMVMATDWRILGLVALMFLVLGTYAVIWQILIKNAQIAVIYANKSSYLLWAQLAAVILFGEHITWCNLAGIIIIFSGILLANGSRNEHA